MPAQYTPLEIATMKRAVSANIPPDRLADLIEGRTPEALAKKLQKLSKSNPEDFPADKVRNCISAYYSRKGNVERHKKEEYSAKGMPVSLGYDIRNIASNNRTITIEIIPDESSNPEFFERDFRTHIEKFSRYLGTPSIPNHIKLRYYKYEGVMAITLDSRCPGSSEFIRRYKERLKAESVKYRHSG